MAQPTLAVTINTLRLDVGMRQGWGRTVGGMTSDNLSDFDLISRQALAEFYFPPIDPTQPSYEWVFLRKAGQITLVSTDKDYDLPEDCSGVVLDDSVCYEAGVNQPPPTKIPEGDIRQLWAGDSQAAGFPKYYSVRNKAHAPTTGQLYEFLTFPIAGATAAVGSGKKLDYRYVYVPDVLSNTNQYPAGGAQYGECIRAAHLAAMEEILDNDPNGPFRQKFIALLATCVRADRESKTNSPQAGTA